LFPGFIPSKNLDLDPQVIDGKGQRADVRKANSVLFRGDDCAYVTFYAALEETLELGFGVPMVIGEFAGQFDARAQSAEPALETLRSCDPTNRTDIEALEIVERQAFVLIKMAQIQGFMRAFNDFCRSIVFSDPGD
jgi:hypothetical protein